MKYNGKDIETMNEREVLEAIAEVSKKLYAETKDQKYAAISAFAKGCNFAIGQGESGDDVYITGLAAVELLNEKEPKDE